MCIMDVIAKLREVKPEIERDYPIRLLGVFGSYARGEERPDSDVDILFENTGPLSLFTIAEVELRLEALLAKGVDLVPRRTLKPLIRDRILAETRPI
jgi:hypothetical protein